MGGAFVAVASDSSATWWNPAGLADGPFVDIALARSATERIEPLPYARERASWFAISAPMAGFSYYRLRLTDIRPFASTESDADGREDRAAGVAVRSTSVSQLGPTFVQTLLPGVHVGTTLKYVRGTPRLEGGDPGASARDLLEQGEELEGGEADGTFDLDIGVLAVAGAFRIGGVVKNIREPEFAGIQLPRQIRLGAALDFERTAAVPLVIAVDGDAQRYDTAWGERQVIAIGTEYWLFTRRLGLRGGARFNRRGAEERSATAGISVLARSGLYLEGHIVRGGTPEERGWGAAMRVSF
jgi:hypothetical protein